MTMTMTRRQALVVTLGISAAAMARMPAYASTEEAEAVVSAFTGGAEPQAGRIVLTVPDVADNGNAVPVSFEVESTMEDDDLVESVIIVADGNPRPEVATFHFTGLSAAAAATTRIRLAQSQTLTAVAKMADGSFIVDRRDISVTVGGCTG
jgi:sulfur-oxidizing protein SoxY